MTLRTDDERDAALTALAEAEGVSRQEMIRRAVLNEYERSGFVGRTCQPKPARHAVRPRRVVRVSPADR